MIEDDLRLVKFTADDAILQCLIPGLASMEADVRSRLLLGIRPIFIFRALCLQIDLEALDELALTAVTPPVCGSHVPNGLDRMLAVTKLRANVADVQDFGANVIR